MAHVCGFLAGLDIGRKAIGPGQAARGLLDRRFPVMRRRSLISRRAAGGTHDHPISAQEAKLLGLNVSTDVPVEVAELMSLYPQRTGAQPSGVEYLPMPRQKERVKAA
jgi:hypothetical protein